jgi:DNA-binding PadR family transcriptional regulator
MTSSRQTDAAARFLPLSPHVFQILLSLVDGPRHGYAIIMDIRERTDHEIRLTASTLYDALTRLVDRRLIEELDEPPDADNHDERRRYYQLSGLGQETARLEARRLERVIEMARGKRLLQERSKGVRVRRS